MKLKNRIICICLILIFASLLVFVIFRVTKKDSFKKANMVSGDIEQTKDFKLYEFGIEDNEICMSMDSIVEEVVERYSKKMDFEYVDVTKNISLSNIYCIETVPTFIIVDKDGNVKYRCVGVMTKEELLAFVSKITK